MPERNGVTIRDSGDENLQRRVEEHLGGYYLNWPRALVAGYVDGGLYGGVPDPRERAAMATTGEEFARGGSGPKRKNPPTPA